MYLRHSTVHKEGKTHTYWRLVRSVRRGGKVRQETVAQLGELDAQGRAKAQALARRMTGPAEQRELFEQASIGQDEPVAVRLDQVRVERSLGNLPRRSSCEASARSDFSSVRPPRQPRALAARRPA